MFPSSCWFLLRKLTSSRSVLSPALLVVTEQSQVTLLFAFLISEEEQGKHVERVRRFLFVQANQGAELQFVLCQVFSFTLVSGVCWQLTL